MHDIELIRKNPEAFSQMIEKRGIERLVVEKILELDTKKRALTKSIQDLQMKRNGVTDKIAELKRDGVEYISEVKESKNITNEINEINPEILKLEDELFILLSSLPNLSLEGVPIGEDESQNVEIRKVGKPKEFSFKPSPHYELGEKLGFMDFKQAAAISGSRFVILKDKLAKLERALINFMLDIHTQEFGCTEVSHPALVLEKTMYEACQLPKFAEDSFVTTDGFRLIPTSEVPLTNLVADSIVNAEDLPMRFTAVSPCFRREAGSAGRDTRGMIRQHQFSKVELVSITTEEQSQEELERMLSIAEEVLKRLELPYRVMLLCSGDMGFAAQMTYDLEVWFPEQGKYREVSSCSSCGTFQARRMKARYYATQDKKIKKFVHTLNSSALAIGRTIAATLENYQNADGSIIVPTVLQSYMNNHKIIL
ncbi:serine--tRNA ligase [Candidatus Mesenet endosymbiont of Agriotes lineatus]|uniref:serine--tRNA ligase n=1 Tax=Candidatus Mesenet endosymbiont of Agriotes lineatus TaxID=3077948 RepID=UPI0030D2C790